MNDNLIVALDVADIYSAKKLVEQIGDRVNFYKIGLEFMMSGDFFNMVEWLKIKEKKIFADLKLYDIPQTVSKAIKNLSQYNIDILTIHSANQAIMEAACLYKRNTKIIAVTLLTSLDRSDIYRMGFEQNISMQDLILKKTDLSLKSGVDGVVASGLEAKNLRNNFGNDFLIVSPAIRLNKIDNDDQKQVCDVKTAIKNGSNYIVVGRPIIKNKNPLIAAGNFQQEISKALLS